MEASHSPLHLPYDTTYHSRNNASFLISGHCIDQFTGLPIAFGDLAIGDRLLVQAIGEIPLFVLQFGRFFDFGLDIDFFLKESLDGLDVRVLLEGGTLGEKSGKGRRFGTSWHCFTFSFAKGDRFRKMASDSSQAADIDCI